MTVKLILTNFLGSFEGEEMEVNKEQLDGLIEKSKAFYEGGFELYTPTGFMVFPPEIVKKTILTIELISDGNANN